MHRYVAAAARKSWTAGCGRDHAAGHDEKLASSHLGPALLASVFIVSQPSPCAEAELRAVRFRRLQSLNRKLFFSFFAGNLPESIGH